MRRPAARLLAALAAISAVTSAVMAQPGPWLAPQEPVAVNVDSGWLQNGSDQITTLFTQTVQVAGAAWMRIAFDAVTLPATLNGGPGAHLRLTSLQDGAVQLLDRTAMRQWKNTSAYFNGDAVLVELVSTPGVGPCRVVITEALRDADAAVPHNTCGATDDRMPSNDPRVARLLPVGCTGWLIRDANFCFLSAGHCATGGGAGMQVIEFNVPLSNANGSLNHPPPADQYALDLESVQASVPPIVIGNDWTYFGAFENSTTGLTPFEAQGDAYVLTTTTPVATGQTLRKTGFGSTDPPVSNTLNQAQKTLDGPITAVTGTQLTYAIDSSGGDSGSPVTDANVAIAIHTNGGCTSFGYNSGCSVRHPDLLAALANPKGVCVPHYFDVTFPNGRPSFVQSLGGTELVVAVAGRNGYVPSPSGVWLHVSFGGPFTSTQMIPLNGGQFQGVFPPMPCGSTLRYYLTLDTTEGHQQIEPKLAPTDVYYTLAASAVSVIASYNFETAGGWTVQNTAVTGGTWERGIPAGDGARGDPAVDQDGSGQCFLTGNVAGDSDVDGGPTRLLSPSWNLTTASRPFISYARWFTNDNQDADRLTVELSNNFGIAWSPIESVSDTPGWVVRHVDVTTFLPATSVMRIRFGVTDDPNNSRTEAAVDAVTVLDVVCPAAGACRKGDVNLDGRINGRDIQSFVSIYVNGEVPSSAANCAADVNSDSTVSADDLSQFASCVMAGGCP